MRNTQQLIATRWFSCVTHISLCAIVFSLYFVGVDVIASATKWSQ